MKQIRKITDKRQINNIYLENVFRIHELSLQHKSLKAGNYIIKNYQKELTSDVPNS